MHTAAVNAPAHHSTPGPARALYLWAELFALFFAVPALLAMIVHPTARFAPLFDALGLDPLNDIGAPTRLLMPALMLFFVAVTAFLLLDPSFNKQHLWGWAALKRALPGIVRGFALAAAVMLTIAWGLAAFTDVMTIPAQGPTPTAPAAPERSAFLMLLRERPEALALILLVYPPLSVYPQEVTHRAFFFHRYRPILPSRHAMIAVNALAFMWLHAPFWNWVALALTLPGGVIFALRYERSASTLAATLEHGLYGWWAFLVGLGWFVFTGSIGR